MTAPQKSESYPGGLPVMNLNMLALVRTKLNDISAFLAYVPEVAPSTKPG